MSQADLDVLRRWAETWNRTDIDAFAATFDDDAELITDPSWMEAGPFKGRAAIRAWFEGLKESWEERDAILLTELFEVDGQVIARVDWQVRGRVSGIDTALDATSVNAIEQGRIVRQQWFFDYASAIQAARVSE